MIHQIENVTHHPLKLFEKDKIHPFVQANIEDILVFDIETTGLSHSYNQVILIGYLYVKNREIILEQLFAETPEEESEILLAFQALSSRFTYLLSYNGNSFDIPFLNSRYKANHLDYILDRSQNVDLLRVARTLSKTLALTDYKLKTVERFLGIMRQDTISGKESVELYNNYVLHPTKKLQHTILLHNYEDILYLGKVLELLNYQKKDDLTHIPLSLEYESNRYYIQTYKLTKDFLTVEIFSRDLRQKRHHFSPRELMLEQTHHVLTLKAPVFQIALEDQHFIFLDIELISENNLSFNALSYEEKLSYLITPEALPQCVKQLFTIIDSNL
ncbi:MAG: ribonuclease H-like domain-containing protein [Clostridia bacterium]|nr:ribonuclease H-like domain-containing protein [Clostridia bacterium]